jgi:hypothetical protein
VGTADQEVNMKLQKCPALFEIRESHRLRRNHRLANGSGPTPSACSSETPAGRCGSPPTGGWQVPERAGPPAAAVLGAFVILSFPGRYRASADALSLAHSARRTRRSSLRRSDAKRSRPQPFSGNFQSLHPLTSFCRAITICDYFFLGNSAERGWRHSTNRAQLFRRRVLK